LKLVIIGEGILRSTLEELIMEYNISDKVILKGAMSQLEIKEEMNAACMLLMPGIIDSKTQNVETQGLVIQEAQAMELPVVISDVGGMKYGVLEGKSGFVIKEADIIGFANIIEQLILDPVTANKMGVAGREFVIANYDNKVINDKLLAIYNSIK
jgi:colanic acid/amylovoran biosynthesis glycosyltransferase